MFSNYFERQLLREHQLKMIRIAKEPLRDSASASSAVFHDSGSQLRVLIVENAVGDGNSFSRAVDRQTNAAGCLQDVPAPPTRAVTAEHHAAAKFPGLRRSVHGKMNSRIDFNPGRLVAGDLELLVAMGGR